jgi:hypothetical protein
MALAQLDLFEDETTSLIKADVAAQRESLRKIQKSLFGKMGDMSKMLFELYAQNEQLNQQYRDAISMITSMNERFEKLECK